MKVWTTSRDEEVIGTLWLMAALLAWSADIHWLACGLFAKAGFDMFCSIVAALIEANRDRKH